MKARLVRIGNSRGIRLPKPLIEQAGLGEDVELRVRGGSIVISRADSSRKGWAEAAAAMTSRGDSGLIDPMISTRFDEGEWEW